MKEPPPLAGVLITLVFGFFLIFCLPIIAIIVVFGWPVLIFLVVTGTLGTLIGGTASVLAFWR